MKYNAIRTALTQNGIDAAVFDRMAEKASRSVPAKALLNSLEAKASPATKKD